jgi:hypothetical protein
MIKSWVPVTRELAYKTVVKKQICSAYIYIYIYNKFKTVVTLFLTVSNLRNL